MRIQRVETIYDQGNTKYPEDGLVVMRRHGLFGVVDGYSAPYAGKPRLFDGISGGQMVAETIVDQFHQRYFPDYFSLMHNLCGANDKISWIWNLRNIPIEPTHLLAGASFVFVQITKDKVSVVQAGDCLAVWQYSPDQNVVIGGTPNLAYQPVSENLKALGRLMEKYTGDKMKAWAEFLPMLEAQRDRDINQPGGYGVLNGQFDAHKYWQETELPAAGLQSLMLFSDGFVPYGLTQNTYSLAKFLFTGHNIKTLANVLADTRFDNDTADEATAIAITFSEE